MYYPKVSVEFRRIDSCNVNKIYDLSKRIFVAVAWGVFLYFAFCATTTKQSIFKKKLKPQNTVQSKPSSEPLFKTEPKF